MKKKRVIGIVGPTASGKTALSLPVAKALGAEIVCMDSMQIYRGMDIGTAKPTPAERALVPHHMLDLLSPDQEYSVYDQSHQPHDNADFTVITDVLCGKEHGCRDDHRPPE